MKAHSNRKRIPSFLEPLLGGVLLIVVLLVANALLASGSSGTTSQPLASRSPSPTSTLSQGDMTAGWELYTDSIAGFSFQYPIDWKITEAKPGRGVTLLEPSSPYYRGIEFFFYENPTQLPATDFTLQRLRNDYRGQLPASLQVRPFQVAKVTGAQVTGIPAGTLTMVVIPRQQRMLWIDLVEGGAIGGVAASSRPTANEDEIVFFRILNTLTFSSQP